MTSHHRWIQLSLVAFVLLRCSSPAPEAAPRWLKGNLHTHTLWSDGDDFPESVLDWYKTRDYDFVAISDHNVLSQGERWVSVADNPGGRAAFDHYVARFGREWVEQSDLTGDLAVRLKTFEEYRTLFDEPDRFLVIQSEEITDQFDAKPIHVNATNVRELIEPQGGSSVLEVLQNNIDAVLEQRRATGHAMFPHVNHPNFGWAVSVDDIAALRGENFFEVYNGHPLVNNEGNDLYPSTERIWDIVLTERLLRGDDAIYGIAVDDAHNYREWDSNHSNPGRGWVMVRSDVLTADAIIAAMEAGDFYASSGVYVDEITISDDVLRLTIRAEPGVVFTTQFVGTRRDVPLERRSGEGWDSVGHRFGDAVGAVLAEAEGLSPSYQATGNELYVRAVVRSSRLKENPYREGEVESAWTQPIILR